MTWTDQQLQLTQTPFLYNSPAHRELVSEKLNEFKRQQTILHNKNKMIGAGFILGFAVNLFGPSLIFMPSSGLVYLGLGAYILHSVESNTKYNEAFKELLTIYDWCVPNSQGLPPFNNALLQNLVESMGTLINTNRIERLTPLINGSQEQASIGSYAASGGQALFSMAKELVVTGETQEDNKMDPATFTVLMRNLVNGKSTSMLDYYMYGEGRFSFSKQLVGRFTSLPIVNKWFNDFLSENVIPEQTNHAHSM